MAKRRTFRGAAVAQRSRDAVARQLAERARRSAAAARSGLAGTFGVAPSVASVAAIEAATTPATTVRGGAALGRTAGRGAARAVGGAVARRAALAPLGFVPGIGQIITGGLLGLTALQLLRGGGGGAADIRAEELESLLISQQRAGVEAQIREEQALGGLIDLNVEAERANRRVRELAELRELIGQEAGRIAEISQVEVPSLAEVAARIGLGL